MKQGIDEHGGCVKGDGNPPSRWNPGRNRRYFLILRMGRTLVPRQYRPKCGFVEMTIVFLPFPLSTLWRDFFLPSAKRKECANERISSFPSPHDPLPDPSPEPPGCGPDRRGGGRPDASDARTPRAAAARTPRAAARGHHVQLRRGHHVQPRKGHGCGPKLFIRS